MINHTIKPTGAKYADIRVHNYTGTIEIVTCDEHGTSIDTIQIDTRGRFREVENGCPDKDCPECSDEDECETTDKPATFKQLSELAAVVENLNEKVDDMIAEAATEFDSLRKRVDSQRKRVDSLGGRRAAREAVDPFARELSKDALAMADSAMNITANHIVGHR